MNIPINVKNRVEGLLVKLPINNSASVIVEKFHTTLLKQNSITPLNEAIYLNNLTNELKNHAWIPEVNDFIVESEFVIKENLDYINILQVYENLKKFKGSEFYTAAIKSLEDLSTSKICLESIQKISEYSWIPQIRELYNNLKENISGIDSSNPNFSITPIISPIFPVSENEFRFYSNGKILEINTNTAQLSQINDNTDLKFQNLVECVELFNINKPNFIFGLRNKKIEIDLNESTVKVENNEIELNKINSFLNNSIGLSTVYEKKQIQLLETLTSNIDEFVSIDESIKIVPIKESGVSYTVFNFGKNLYGQFVNPTMSQNTLNVFESVTEILVDIKNKLNFDAKSCLSELVKEEEKLFDKTKTLQKTLQLKIAKLQDKKNKFISEARNSNILEHSKIKETIELLEAEIISLLKDIMPIDEKVSIKVLLNGIVNTGVCFISELITEKMVKSFVNNQSVSINRNQIEIV